MLKKCIKIFIIAILISSTFLPMVNANTITTNQKRNGDINQQLLDDIKIYVKIEEIKAYDNPDPWPWAKEADFKIYVTVDGDTKSKSFASDDNHITPNWVESFTLSYKKYVEIKLKLVDRDVGSEETCDINPDSGSKACKITYNTETGKWTGDDGGDGQSRGNSYPECEIWFDIWHEGGNNGGDKLTVDANGPYTGKTGEKIQLTATAKGGKPPYKNWYWIIFKEDKIYKEFHKQNPTVIFPEKGTYLALVQVDDQKNNHAEDQTTIYIDEPEKKTETFVVLVAGGTGNSKVLEWLGTENLDENFENDAEHAYNTFKKLGYKDDHIYWLSGAKKIGNADGKTTKTNVKNAITRWLKGKSTKATNCFIFISDHGADFPGYPICVFPGRPYNIWEMIFAWELDSWLDEVDYNVCIIVIEACYSGGFIKYCSEKNRIIMTATDSKNPAYTGDKGIFVEPFFNKLGKGASYGEAWMAADKYVDSAPDDQNPQIDDNGDKKGHGTSSIDTLPIGGDGYLALNTYP